MTVHPSAAAGHGDTRELCVYIFRYRKAANDYCRRPHQVVRIQHLAGQATTTTIKDLITGIIGEYTVKHLFINRMDLQLLPDRTSFPGLGGDLDAWSENSHPDQGFHIIDGPEVAQPPSIIQAADVVCRRLSKPEVYQCKSTCLWLLK